MNDLNILINRLDTNSKTSLEQAVNYCMQRQHYTVEIAHWLFVFLSNKDSSFVQVLKHYQCCLDKICDDINTRLETFKVGNEQAPVISHQITTWINEAWSMASLILEKQFITPDILCGTLTKNTILNQIICSISDEFSKLSEVNMLETLQSIHTNHNETANNDKTKKTSELDKYTHNLNLQATLGKIDQVIGRENEIYNMVDVLSRRRQNNVILVGEPGVGKTALVEGLALKVIQQEVPVNLQDVEIRLLDMGLLQAGASVKGEFEKRLNNVIKEVKAAAHEIILFIDEAHCLIGAGGQSGQNDAANLLKPALARGEFKTIAATTWREYKQYFEKDAALTRRFQVIKIEEPSTKDAINMLSALVPSMEKHHQVTILDEAIENAVLLSQQYLTDRQLPDKCISVLDTACSRVAGKLNAKPLVLCKNENDIRLLETDLSRLKKEEQQGIKHNKINKKEKQIAIIQKENEKLQQQWFEEKEIINKIIHQKAILSETYDKEKKQQLKKYYRDLKNIQKGKPLLQAFVDKIIISEVIADWTGIPANHMRQDQAKQITQVDARLSQKIIAQEYAVDIISKNLKTNRLKLTDPNKPLGVFLLLGPSGVGKTETALTLAEEIFGSREHQITINMSEFKEAHRVSLLSGSPPGYVGYGEGGILTEAVRKKPYSLILLDEIEKAHPSFQDVFYQVFDKGMLKDGQGEEINFKNTLIIMTSNACDHKINQYDNTTAPNFKMNTLIKSLEHDLTQYFKPAFLGRVTVVPYLPLDNKALQEIIKLKLNQVKQRLKKQHNTNINYKDNFIDYLIQSCQKNIIGARFIDNKINQQLLPAIADLLIEKIIAKKTVKEIDVSFDGHSISVVG